MLSLGIGLVLGSLITGTGFYILQQKPLAVKNEKIPLSEVVASPSLTISNITWGKYQNEDYRLSIAHPNTYVVDDQLATSLAEWKPNKQLYLTNTSHPKKPAIAIDIPYDGYGPFFPNKEWEVELPSGGNVKVVGEKNISSENSPQDSVYIRTSEIAWDQRSMWISITYQGTEDLELEEEFKAIISTIKQE